MSPNAFRVARVERASCVILGPDGPRTIRAEKPVAVGDHVLVEEDSVVEVLARRTELRRSSVSGQSVDQVLAANVDIVGVCIPLETDARIGRLERFLAIAWASGARPLIVATKADLCPPEDFGIVVAELGNAAPGVEVLPVSIADPDTLDPLRAHLAPDRTLAVLGASGVGKSSLINALLGEQRLATTSIREDGKGRHTTAWRELVELPGGGYLIDTPGLRGVGVADAAEGVEAVFADVVELSGLCKFTDCRHEGEPGCAIDEAVRDGRLDPQRLARHRKLQRELAYQERRYDARARAEEKAKWKARAKAQRDRYGAS